MRIGNLFIFIIKMYQLVISPFLVDSCRFHPTCSQYAEQAFKKYGVFRAMYLTIRRIFRCHPWGGSGYDPVP